MNKTIRQLEAIKSIVDFYNNESDKAHKTYKEMGLFDDEFIQQIDDLFKIQAFEYILEVVNGK